MSDHPNDTPDGSGLRVAVLYTRWYPELIEGLRQGATTTLTAMGVAAEDILEVEVPGAFELPQAAAWVARAQDVDAIVVVGCILRGETPHFDFVASACADGITRVALDSGLPIGFGVITADTLAQAEARATVDASGKGGNKGVEAADAAVRMACTYKMLEGMRSS